MEIYFDKRAVRQIRISAADAIDEGDTSTLREDIREAFTEEQIEEIERRIDTGDINDLFDDVFDEWGNDDIEELFELLEGQLADADIDLKYQSPEMDDDEEEEDDEGDMDDDFDDGGEEPPPA
ncbi:MAG: hypothetical protein CMN30_10920 [Sandaracinus sp.]|nr:hypothetical protein [Sandaracinus sp.]